MDAALSIRVHSEKCTKYVGSLCEAHGLKHFSFRFIRVNHAIAVPKLRTPIVGLLHGRVLRHDVVVDLLREKVNEETQMVIMAAKKLNFRLQK